MASETQPATIDHNSSPSQHNHKKSGFLQQEVTTVQGFVNKFNNDWSMTFAGTLAYSLLGAMLPILIALIAILGFILGAIRLGNIRDITNQIAQIFPQAANQSATIDLAFQQLQKSAGWLGLIAVLLAIFGGSRLFIGIEGCLDIVYRVRPRTLIRQNLMALAMLLLFIILIPIMIFASSAPTFFFSALQNTPIKDIPGMGLLFSLGGILGAFIAAFILMWSIYIIVPNQKISLRNSWCGAFVTAILLELFLTLFPTYIARFMNSYTGQIGFAIILLAFFYYFAVILILGAEINAYFFEKVHPLPNDLATFVSTMAGRLEHDTPPVEGQPHQNPRPTEKADDAHIESAKQKSEQSLQSVSYEQSPPRSSPAQRAKKPAKKASGPHYPRWLATLEVALGSALVALIEWFRLRRRQSQ
jgi:YihY family inner membrane protein